MRILITGATGLVGRRLLEFIDEPVVLSRNPEAARASLGRGEFLPWDPLVGPPPAEAFRGVEAVVHLAGEPVAEGRWNERKKALIRDSRVMGTRNLVRGLAEVAERPRVLVSASAVGWYGSQGDRELDESLPAASGFLADVCRGWEEAAAPARNLGLRVVHPRIGIVLAEQGGALGKMLTPFKLGAGGPLGSGTQWMPWVHVDDLVGLIFHAIEHAELDGPMNAVGPRPVTNREFTRTLAGVLGRPAFLPAPAFGLRLMLGEFADVLLASQRCLPKAAERTGYAFLYPTLESALRAILRGEGRKQPRTLAAGVAS